MDAVRQVFGENGYRHRVEVYVPGTTSVDRELTTEEHRSRVGAALQVLSSVFGGATALPAQGGWVTKQGKLVREPVTIVFSYAPSLSIGQLQTVRQFALGLKDELGQECVTVVVDGEMFLI